ncbi:MAG: hypothetical protein KAJ03_05150 [Gammaproteobacteria bacterium]|nr:hypothetical protein [Gammaproteobacteria bacterium]
MENIESALEWKPLFHSDFKLDFFSNPISFIRHRVFKRNEAWDIAVRGGRGMGKSTLGLSLTLLLNPHLLKMTPKDALDQCWCFTTEDRNEKKKKLKRGSVLCMDEQGTSLSGSSYKFRDKENQDYADNIQLSRVDGVIEVGITLDDMRLAKRVRDVYRVVVHPERKISDEGNDGNGMAIECIFREIRENPFAKTDTDRFKPSYFKYASGGRIARVVIPAPPVAFWNEYMRRRKAFKEDIERQSMPKQPDSVEQTINKMING